jgi:large subunit ribosomal protein L25
VKAGAKAEKVLPRDVQFDVVKDFPIHVDLLRVAADAEVTIDVPVVFTDEDDCPGLRRGGVLNVVRHEIEVHCKATAMPEEIHASLKGLEIGDSLHISAIPLPDGVQPTIADRDFTVATIAPPTVAPAEEEEAAEAAAEAGEAEEAEAEAEAEAGEGEEAEE